MGDSVKNTVKSAIVEFQLLPMTPNGKGIQTVKTALSKTAQAESHIGDQRRLRRACASAQSRQSLRCSHTWSMEVDEESDQNSMRVWRMSLQRTKSARISWAGSFGGCLFFSALPLGWRGGLWYHLSRLVTKPTKWHVRPVWSASSLYAQWVAKDPSFLYADSEDTGWCPGWSESSLGAHATLLVSSWGGLLSFFIRSWMLGAFISACNWSYFRLKWND